MSAIIVVTKESKRRYDGIPAIGHGSIVDEAVRDAARLNGTMEVAEILPGRT